MRRKGERKEEGGGEYKEMGRERERRMRKRRRGEGEEDRGGK